MASVTYSFIDIAVLDGVRARFAAGDALVVLSPELDEILWANGPGAALLGFAEIEAAIGMKPELSIPARRQIMATPGFPNIRSERTMAIRLARGVAAPVLNFRICALRLPAGETAILLSLPANGIARRDRQAHSAAIIDGFGAPGQFAALLEADGVVTAASRGFESLGISGDTLQKLVDEVRDEEDRVVKRRIDAEKGKLPAGLARLTDDPALHLLLVIDEVEAVAPENTGAAEEPVTGDASALDAPHAGAKSESPVAPEAHREEAPAIGEEPAMKVGTPGDEDATSAQLFTPASLETGADEALDGVETSPEEPHAKAAEKAESTASASGGSRPSGTVRFAWRTDAEGRFTALSDPFAEAVGAPAADVIGRSFREVSNAFGLDMDGRISALLERRDTWSGRTVMWPIAGTDRKVPVDLAALPIYGRGRVFEGFHGFGLARMADAVPDPEKIGLVLVPGAPPLGQTSQTPDEETDVVEASDPTAASTEVTEPAETESVPQAEAPRNDVLADDGHEAVAEDRRETVEQEEPEREEPNIHETEKVVPLPARGLNRPEGRLSDTEQLAFRQIGQRLRESFEPAATKPDAEERKDPGDGAAQGVHSAQAAAVAPVNKEEDAPASGMETEERGETVKQPIREATGEDAEALQNRQETADAGRADAATKPDQPAPAATRLIKGEGFLPSAFHLAGGPDKAAEAVTSLLEPLPLPVIVHSGDRLHYANRAFLSLTGHADLATLEAEGGLDILFVEPDEDGPSEREAASTRKLRRADGEIIEVDAHLQSISWPPRKALLLALTPVAGEPAPAVVDGGEDEAFLESEAEDARVDAQTAELQMHLAEMRAIVDTATDGVAIIDNEGRVRSTNQPAEALFGVDEKDVTGKPFTDLFAIESQRAVQEHINSLSDNGVASVLNDGLEVIGREAQGGFIPLFMTLGRLPAQSGFCAVLRDITQWKQAEEELTQARAEAERASSQKTEFLARVSHEIRTPLNAIIGFSELMIDEKFGPVGNERYRDYLRDINRSGNHVLDLVNDLLDISKIEAGQQEMHYEAVPLNEILAHAVAMMQPQANRERVIIRSSYASNLPDVVADPRSVRQIALNLLSNAVRYTPAGGQVIVSTAYGSDGSVAMRVRDTGVGMSSAEIDEALKPFKQINSLKRKRNDGTGLGLPLTRAMVEANRANFNISSVPDEGTLVEILFPPTRVLAD